MKNISDSQDHMEKISEMQNEIICLRNDLNTRENLFNDLQYNCDEKDTEIKTLNNTISILNQEMESLHQSYRGQIEILTKKLTEFEELDVLKV